MISGDYFMSFITVDDSQWNDKQWEGLRDLYACRKCIFASDRPLWCICCNRRISWRSWCKSNYSIVTALGLHYIFITCCSEIQCISLHIWLLSCTPSHTIFLILLLSLLYFFLIFNMVDFVEHWRKVFLSFYSYFNYNNLKCVYYFTANAFAIH